MVAGTRALLQRRDRALAAGERQVGWKLAFGVPETRRRLGIAGPVIGCLTDATALESGATVAIEGWARAALEAEVAIHLGRDVRAGEGVESARDGIAALGPAIELADVDLPPERLAEVIGGGLYHRAVIAAPPRGRRVGDAADDLAVVVKRGGEVCAREDDPQAVVGAPAAVVAYVAEYLGAFGEVLRDGEMIISGSTIGLLDVSPGDEVEFALDPVGSLSVSCG